MDYLKEAVEARLLDDILKMPSPATPVVDLLDLLQPPAATTTHPDELLSQNLTQPCYKVENDNPTTLCQLPHHHPSSVDRGGAKPHYTSVASGGNTSSAASGGDTSSAPRGSASVLPASDAQQAGEVRPAKCTRFSEAPPAYGTVPAKWWDC